VTLKNPLFFFLLIILFISSAFIAIALSSQANFFFSQGSEDHTFEAASVDTIKHFTNTGDFIDWAVMNGSADGWDDTGDSLYSFVEDGTLFTMRPCLNISTSHITNISWNVKIDCLQGDTALYREMGLWIWVMYNDGSNTTVYSWFEDCPPGGGRYYEGWLNLSTDSGKYIDYFMIEQYSETVDVLNKIWIYDELYEGRLTKAHNITTTPSLKNVYDYVWFNCDISNRTANLQSVVLNLIFEGKTKAFVMSEDWSSSDYTKAVQFNATGSYIYFISVYLSFWNVVCDSEMGAFTVTEYPKESYLTIWQPTGLSIPNNLKVYLGRSETHEIFMPQIDKNPALTPYAGNVSGRYLTYRSEDNKLYIDAIRNGVTMNCSDANGLYPNITYYESLVFDVRVNWINTTSLQYIVIGINSFSADYYLSYNIEYLGTWVQYIIPFPMFTYRVESDTLGELTFYGHLNCEIKNVFVADYKNLTTILAYGQNTTAEYELSSAYNSTLTAFPGNNTLTSSAAWNNYTDWLNHTDPFTCTNSSGNEANITTVMNGISDGTLNATGIYLAESTFTWDSLGADPTGNETTWTIWETGTSISVENEGSFHHVCKIYDNSASYYAEMYRDPAPRDFGSSAFWFMSTDVSDYIRLWQSAGNGGGAPNYVIFLTMNGGSLYINEQGSDTKICDLMSNSWTHIQIDFETSSGGYKGLAQFTQQIYVNTTLMGTYQLYANRSNIYRETISTYGVANTPTVFVDAIDSEFASGYVRWRSYNETYEEVAPYSLNQTTYFNFSTIEKANIENIAWNSNIAVNGTSYAESHIDAFNGTSEFIDCDEETYESNDYTYTNYTMSGYVWALLGQGSTSSQAVYFHFYFNVSEIIDNPLWSENVTLWIYLVEREYFQERDGCLEAYNYSSSSWYWLTNTSSDGTYDLHFSIAYNIAATNGTFYVRYRCGQRRFSKVGYHYAADVYFYNAWLTPEVNYTLSFYNFTSSAFVPTSLTNLTYSTSLPIDYFNGSTVLSRLYINSSIYFELNYTATVNITYFFYTNASAVAYYVLNASTLYYYYNWSLTKSEEGSTNVYFYWYTSSDNASWSAANTSLIINAYAQCYLKIRIDCNTSYIWNYSSFSEADLFFKYQNRTCYYATVELVTSFTMPNPAIFRGVNLTVNTILNISTSLLFNSSMAIYNFTDSTYENKSAISLSYDTNLTNDYYNATYHVKIKVACYAFGNASFTLNFTRTDLNVSAYLFNKTCYITSTFALNNSFNISVFHFYFNPEPYSYGDNQILLYFYNATSSSWFLNSTYNYLTTNRTVTLYIPYTAEITKFRWKFVYDALGNDQNISAYVWFHYFAGALEYRLISDLNRQNPALLSFDSEYECLCLTDFYGTIVYKQFINRTTAGEWIDIMLNFWEVTFTNFVPNSQVTFNVTNRNLNLSVSLSYGQSITIGLFTDDYVIVAYHEENKTVISTWDVVISRTKQRSFAYNYSVAVSPDYPQRSTWSYFLQNNWMFILMVILSVGVILYMLPERVKKKLLKRNSPPVSLKRPKKKRKRPKYYITKGG